ncbi:hypothetical protein FJZ31_24030 [Candidatus Poribacteria bacterium]|nr:hypothetical protein [Candidatus Poribacteria bacterium]
MHQYGWYRFEWDDENMFVRWPHQYSINKGIAEYKGQNIRKTGTSSICASTTLSQKKRRNVFSKTINLVVMSGDLMMSIF